MSPLVLSQTLIPASVPCNDDPSAGEPDPSLASPNRPFPSQAYICVTYKDYRGRLRLRPRRASTLRQNNVHLGAAFLDLGNAADIGANVFNEIPPPRRAVVVMVIGAIVGMLIWPFALIDGWRSWSNIKILRAERRRLMDLSVAWPSSMENADISLAPLPLNERALSAAKDDPARRSGLLRLNTRELAIELAERLTYDILFGFGVFTVIIGTFMAVGGANHKVFTASNILTGYVGNVPAGIYGIYNAAYAVYRWRNASASSVARYAAQTGHAGGDIVLQVLTSHERRVKIHAVLSGVVGIVNAAGSLMTASTYLHDVGAWGYIILALCLIGQIVLNRWLRHRVYYDRDTTDTGACDPQWIERALVTDCMVRRELCLQLAGRDGRRTVIGNHRRARPSADAVMALLERLERCVSGRLLDEKSARKDEAITFQQPTHVSNTATGSDPRSLQRILRTLAVIDPLLPPEVAARWCNVLIDRGVDISSCLIDLPGGSRGSRNVQLNLSVLALITSQADGSSTWMLEVAGLSIASSALARIDGRIRARAELLLALGADH